MTGTKRVLFPTLIPNRVSKDESLQESRLNQFQSFITTRITKN